MAGRLLNLCKTIDKRLWGFENPLRQFPLLTSEILHKLESKKMTVDRLKEMDPKEIGQRSSLKSNILNAFIQKYVLFVFNTVISIHYACKNDIITGNMYY